jgi:hypothetical protein
MSWVDSMLFQQVAAVAEPHTVVTAGVAVSWSHPGERKRARGNVKG